MNKEIKSVLKKTTKIAGVTCVAAGAVALMTSSVALKAIGEGGRYLVNTVKKIVNEQDQPEVILNETAAEEDFASEEAPAEEAVPEERCNPVRLS